METEIGKLKNLRNIFNFHFLHTSVSFQTESPMGGGTLTLYLLFDVFWTQVQGAEWDLGGTGLNLNFY